MVQTSPEWINDWSIEKFSPITHNWVSMGHGTDEEPMQSLSQSTFAKAMKEKYGDGMKILDYGCGTGRFANFLSKRLKNFKYIGLEKAGGTTYWGETSVRDGLINAGHDDRFRLGFTESLLEKKAIEESDVVLLCSVFTHTTIEETHRIISKLMPIVNRGGRVVFSMIHADTYSLNGSLYGFDQCYEVTYNTKEQVEEIARKFNANVKLEEEFLADWCYLHSIYSITSIE
jgi:2-polyprenyl-3-methyl-5-hydroxy-6-metoxy-1,4-benzoquinol methylase